MKKCSKCGIEKSTSEFHKDSRLKSGLRACCKECWSKHSKKYRSKPEVKSRAAKYHQEYYKQNKADIRKNQTEYRSQPQVKRKIAEYYRTYAKENPEVISKGIARSNYKKRHIEKSCIYTITNTATGRIYIGETLQYDTRKQQHISRLRGGYHGNKYLQEDYFKYGEESFEFSILREVEKNKSTLLLEEAKEIRRHIEAKLDMYNLTLTIQQLRLLEKHGE